MVGNHKGVHKVILWQVSIGFLEFPHLLGIEDMDLPLEPSKVAILPERVDKAVSVYGSGFQTNYPFGKCKSYSAVVFRLAEYDYIS